MKKIVAVTLLLAAWIAPSDLFGQWICLGKSGHGCTKEEFKAICDEEKVPSSLMIAKSARVKGELLDDSGAFVNFDKTVLEIKTLIQIKDPKAGAILFSVPLRENGQFEFESIPAGEYRLVAVWFKDGEFRRLPLAEQPRTMSCTEAAECNINAIIHFHGTDNPIDSCPPR